jgi:hypothetical protein
LDLRYRCLLIGALATLPCAVAQAQVTGRPSDAAKIEQLRQQTNKLLQQNSAGNAQLSPEERAKLEQMYLLRSMRARGGGRGPQSGAPIILNGGPPTGPIAAPPAKTANGKVRKSSQEKRAEARQKQEERRKKLKEEVERKKAEKAKDNLVP